MRYLRALWIIFSLACHEEQGWGASLSPIAQAKQSVATLYVMKADFPKTKTSLSPRNKPPILTCSSAVLVTLSILLTSYHLVEKAQKIEVVFGNGIKRLASFFKTAPFYDLAALRLNSWDDLNIEGLPLGDETSLEEEENIFAISNMWGLPQSISKGVVSCLNRRLPTSPFPLIRTDTPLGPGSSGRALISRRGELVGLTTTIFNDKEQTLRVGFAIPARFLKDSLGNSS